MRVPVTVPSLLANCTGGARDVEVEAATLEGCLDALLVAYPLLRPHLLDEAGNLRPHVNLFLNDQNARWIDDWAGVRLAPGDTLTVIQAVSGG
jgi:molybdopterin converting factor small subunit